MALLKMHLHTCMPKYTHVHMNPHSPPRHLGTPFLHGSKGLKQNSDYLPAGLVATLTGFHTSQFAVLGMELGAFGMLARCSATKLPPQFSQKCHPQMSSLWRKWQRDMLLVQHLQDLSARGATAHLFLSLYPRLPCSLKPVTAKTSLSIQKPLTTLTFIH